MEDIIENAEDILVKDEAIGKIRNQDILKNIVFSDKEEGLRSTALYYIEDERVIHDFYRDGYGDLIGESIIRDRITDNDFLLNLQTRKINIVK